MNPTGILGTRSSALGNLTLRGSSGQEDLVAGSPGVLLYFGCDDLTGAAYVAEKFGHPAAVTGTIAGGNVGIDGTTVWTPSATVPEVSPPYTKDVTSHASVAGGDVTITDAATVELWFRPDEFGDMFRNDGGIVTPGVEYEVLQLESAGYAVLTLALTQSDLGAQPTQLWVRFNTTAGDLVNRQAFVPFQGNNLWPTQPPLEKGRWYHLAVAWDAYGTRFFVNGTLAGRLDGYHPPLPFGTASLRFGQCGGQYKMVTLSGLKLTDAQVAKRWGSAFPPASEPSTAQATSAFATYAATYNPNVRTTRLAVEVLRTGSRNARVSNLRVEVLRTVDSTGVITPTVVQDFTFTQTATATITQGSVQHSGAGTGSLTFTETASIFKADTRVITRDGWATQTLTFRESARRAIVQSAAQTLSFTETATGLASKDARDTLEFTQAVTLAFERNRRLLQTLSFQQTTGHVGRSHAIAVTQTLAITESGGLGRFMNRAFLQALDFTDTASGFVIHTHVADAADALVFTEHTEGFRGKRANAADHLLLVDGVILRRVWHRSVGDTLAFTDGATRGPMTIRRAVTDTLTFHDRDIPTELPIFIDGKPVVITVPVARIVKTKRQVLLTSRHGAVVLPPPEFGDSEAMNHQVAVKRTMTGIFYTYVKTSPTRVLNYEFTVTRALALELRDFVEASLSDPVILTDWKGATYVGNILNNPVTLTSKGRYSRSSEKVGVTLNFEGVRL